VVVRLRVTPSDGRTAVFVLYWVLTLQAHVTPDMQRLHKHLHDRFTLELYLKYIRTSLLPMSGPCYSLRHVMTHVPFREKPYYGCA
jgi:hypothetical protein